jgi:hypothetical protein
MGKKERQDGLDAIDLANLRKNKYEEVQKKYTDVFILKHKNFPNKVVELKAASSVHACNLIGWRPRHVELVQKDTDKEEVT